MGKSTTLWTAFGLCRRFGGTVVMDGAPMPANRPHLLARRGASFMPEDRGVLPSLTVQENLELARIRGYRPAVDPRDVFPLLTERPRQLAGTLSGGQQQQLGIARAVLAGSRLVAIDEVTQGLQPSIVTSVMQMVTELAGAGIGLLLVDQSPRTLAQWCHRILVMEAGRVVFDEPVTAATTDHVSELLQLR